MKKQELPKVAILAKHIIKNNTNADQKCKQYFVLIVGEDKPDEIALIVEKYILSDRNDDLLHDGFVMLKLFKGKILYRQIFGVKVDTLFTAIEKLSQFPVPCQP